MSLVRYEGDGSDKWQDFVEYMVDDSEQYPPFLLPTQLLCEDVSRYILRINSHINIVPYIKSRTVLDINSYKHQHCTLPKYTPTKEYTYPPLGP